MNYQLTKFPKITKSLQFPKAEFLVALRRKRNTFGQNLTFIYIQICEPCSPHFFTNVANKRILMGCEKTALQKQEGT